MDPSQKSFIPGKIEDIRCFKSQEGEITMWKYSIYARLLLFLPSQNFQPSGAITSRECNKQMGKINLRTCSWFMKFTNIPCSTISVNTRVKVLSKLLFIY